VSIYGIETGYSIALRACTSWNYCWIYCCSNSNCSLFSD